MSVISSHRDRALLGWIELLFLASGAAALTYQVCWQRLLFAAYGVDVESTTIIVSAFMLGLGLGALLGGRIADRFPSRILFAFALLELGLSAIGAASPAVFAWLAEVTAGSPRTIVAVISFGLLLVPTSLMGATLPLLVAYFDEYLRCVGASVGRLYFVNTVGAALGAFATGFVLFDRMDLAAAVWLAAAVNASGGIAALVLAGRRP